MIDWNDAEALLGEVLVDQLPHFDRNLQDHLAGTRRLLEEWGASKALCAAGLFHSIYGTERYRLKKLSAAIRAEVQKVIGSKAERLVYLFCIMERQSLGDNLERWQGFQLKDRSSGAKFSVTAAEFRDICMLFVANWLEQQASAPPRAKYRYAAELSRMEPFVTQQAWAAIVAAYGNLFKKRAASQGG